MTFDLKESDGAEQREEFKHLKGTVSIEDLKLLDKEVTKMKDVWRLGALHAQFKRLKRNSLPELPTLKR